MNINIFDRYNDKELWQKDLDHVVHPWATYPAFDKEGAKFIAESQGGYVYDSSGNKYLDGVGGIWCVNIGYGREEMAQTMAEQAMRLPFYNAFTNISNPPLAELSAKLAELTPAKLNHSFLSTGGSVANDSAIRIVHHYFHRLGKPEKRKIISRKDAYHGSTYMAMSLTGTPSSRKDFHFANDIVEHVSAPNLYRRPEGMSPAAFCDHLIEELEAKILELGPENVAAFIAEPIMGSGGVLVPPDGYIKRAFEICKKYEMLYISDEVVTGFGRLGHWFASEPVYGIQPDIITSAKGLTSGYQPLGATIISDEIHEVMRSPEIGDNLFYHGFTYSGHPIACAVALTNIDIIERENILDHVQEVGPYFEQRLATLLDYPLIGDVRGSHFMLAIESVANKETKEMLPDSIDVADRIAMASEERGLIVRSNGHINIFSPALILTREDIDFMVNVLGEAIVEVADGLTQEGVKLS